MKKLKLLFLIFTITISTLLFTINIDASEYESTESIINSYVDNGNLNSFHKKYSNKSEYQTYFTKQVLMSSNPSNGLEYLNTLSEGEIRSIIRQYKNRWNTVWYDVLTNLDIEPEYLNKNEVLGIYFDTNLNSDTAYLYLLWTSKYIPSEFMGINSLEVNGKSYNHYNSSNYLDFNFYDSDYYHFPEYDLTIHKTPIGGFNEGKEFGVSLTNEYQFNNIEIGIDKTQFINDPDPTNKYTSIINSYATFNLGTTPKLKERRMCQLVTHAYELIKDCEVQSYYDLGFGGYIHLVHFNTSISIDAIYRVDVSYILTSDNKDWWQFWLSEDERSVLKSLRPDHKSTGIFGLYDTYGFKEGIFKSNDTESKTYKYELMLNYSEQNWDLFSNNDFSESNYKRIKNFQILRLNYLLKDKVYDVEVKMDPVDGDTLSILDKNLILDTESNLWKVKDKVYSIADGIELARNIIVTAISVIAGIILIYLTYKIIKTIKEAFNETKK